MIQLTILGNSAATPAHNRFPTAQFLTLPHNRFLIDCGEGVQMQMQKYKVKMGYVRSILISHLHGDHYLGLIGLLSSMHLQGRGEDINIYAPADLAEIIRVNMRYSHTTLNFKVNFFPLVPQKGEIFYEDDQVTIETMLMNHRIECYGFLFREKPKKKKVLAEKLPADTPWQIMVALKDGQDILDEQGNILYKCEDYTFQPPQYKFAHCSDTKYNEDLLEQLYQADMIYHEATYIEEDAAKAEYTFHSTAQQAATIAQKAQVGKLVIGHFSSRYRELDAHLYEARQIFPNTFLGIEGETISTDNWKDAYIIEDSTIKMLDNH
jgi:ribonuclease Z